MDRSSKKELLRTIDEQQETIGKYQNKLKDVVAAYKTLQKEKELLEKSLQALGDSSSAPEQDTVEEEATKHEESTSDSQSEDATDTENRSTRSSLQKQVATLSASLSTLTKEKSKMEASFQADKKRLRMEFEEKEELLQKELDELKAENDNLKQEVHEWRGRVREVQVVQERDEGNHALMMRELQQLLASERAGKESLEQQLEDMKSDHERKMSEVQNEQTQVTRRLENEIASLNKLLASNKKADVTSALENEIEELKKHTTFLKTQHNSALEREQQVSAELLEKLAARDKEHEDRAGALEAQLSELAQAVGDGERQRSSEQQAKLKLQQRLAQLEQENSALLEAAAKQGASPGSKQANTEDGDASLELSAIVENFVTAKNKLLDANGLSSSPVDVTELLQDLDLHESCHSELNVVKEEFERYKLRAQSVLKLNKTQKSHEQRAGEVESLRTQVNELKEKLWQLRSDKEDLEQDLRKKEENSMKAMESLRESHKTEVNRLEEEHKEKEAELNMEMKKHRERTIALLSEKDSEIESLKGRVGEPVYAEFSTQQEAGASSEEQAITELLSRGSSLTARGDTALLHFAQEQARKEVEVVQLRRQKHFLESSLREAQQNAAQRESQLLDQAQLLKEEVRRHERSLSRESANLEYLKNVVLKYMVCTDLNGQLQMLNAISTILQFSPQEKDGVQHHLHSGWLAAFRKSSHHK